MMDIKDCCDATAWSPSIRIEYANIRMWDVRCGTKIATELVSSGRKKIGIRNSLFVLFFFFIICSLDSLFLLFSFLSHLFDMGKLSQSQSSHIPAKYQGAIVRFTSLDVNWRTTQYLTRWWIGDVHSRMMSFFVNYYYSRRPPDDLPTTSRRPPDDLPTTSNEYSMDLWNTVIPSWDRIDSRYKVDKRASQ